MESLLIVVGVSLNLNTFSASGSLLSSSLAAHHWTRNPFLYSSEFNGGFVPKSPTSKRSRLKPPLRHLRQRGKINGISRRASPSKSVVHFFIYPDPTNPSYKEELVVGNNASLSSYKSDYNAIILIQDYMQNYSRIYPQRTKDAYLGQKFKSNIIIADWNAFAFPKFGLINNIATRYPRISRKVSRISRQITDLLMYLSSQNLLLDPSTVHLIGFGLGAQIAGVTGNNYKRSTGNMIGRISGLDPSGLQYHYTAQSEKLDRSDARLVDVYHTTTAPFGFGNSIGTVDFYPNGGGPTQPGCKSTLLMDMMKDIPGMEGSCAHNRAWEYFTDSIFNNKLYACQSKSYLLYKMKTFCAKPVIFGQHVSNQASGNYFLEVMHKDT